MAGAIGDRGRGADRVLQGHRRDRRAGRPERSIDGLCSARGRDRDRDGARRPVRRLDGRCRHGRRRGAGRLGYPVARGAAWVASSATVAHRRPGARRFVRRRSRAARRRRCPSREPCGAPDQRRERGHRLCRPRCRGPRRSGAGRRRRRSDAGRGREPPAASRGRCERAGDRRVARPHDLGRRRQRRRMERRVTAGPIASLERARTHVVRAGRGSATARPRRRRRTSWARSRPRRASFACSRWGSIPPR